MVAVTRGPRLRDPRPRRDGRSTSDVGRPGAGRPRARARLARPTYPIDPLASARVTVRDEIELLVARSHPEPHRVLGAHPGRRGATVRAYRPGATRVRVLRGAHEPVRLRRVHGEGVFAGTLEAAALPLRYELETTWPDGTVTVAPDAYAFLPTLGELDLHLLREGRHEQLQAVLGAHRRTVDGVEGVGFAVWAPAARSVSVVGDWNAWDGRQHPMRSLGSAGVWELFVPGVEDGARYKFEVRGSDGVVRLRADPLPPPPPPPQPPQLIATNVMADTARTRTINLFE